MPPAYQIPGAPRVETMTMRLSPRGGTRDAALAQRLREDLAKFPWQRIEPSAAGGAGLLVTTAARHIPDGLTIRLPVADKTLAQYLQPTARINSRDPQVVALAREIAGEDADGRSVARKIGAWTWQNLTWKKVESDAAGTLASREADCLEHSELYVALARALGLPARVVTGAALSDGAFGAHAWVEVYLGRWVELDPTWGLTDHVDATHLRFDGDAFTSYAMLNQLDVEILAVRRTTAEFQRTPAGVVREFNRSPKSAELAFDASLIIDAAIGRSAWDALDARKRALAVAAVERAIRRLSPAEQPEDPDEISGPAIHVLRSENRGDRALLTALVADSLVRFHLAQRDGAWFIVEYEDLDQALPRFADALRGALTPERARGPLYDAGDEKAEARVDRLLAAEGESPELFLLKALVQNNRRIRASLEKLLAAAKEKTDEKPEAPPEPAPLLANPARETLERLVARWPDFTPGLLQLGRHLLSLNASDDAIDPLHKDTEAAIRAFERYLRLVPFDPRPHHDLFEAFASLEQFDKAEAALRQAIRLDADNYSYQGELVGFLLARDNPIKARAAFADLLRKIGDPDEAFATLADQYDTYDLAEEDAEALVRFLPSFPRELARSKSGLYLLAESQGALNRTADAIRTAQRIVSIDPEPDDYEYLSSLHRRARRFPEALAAAAQALKLDPKSADAHFERACALAQLGRKRDALAALKQMIDLAGDPFFNADDPDLQPLAPLPEFKALKEKMKSEQDK